MYRLIITIFNNNRINKNNDNKLILQNQPLFMKGENMQATPTKATDKEIIEVIRDYIIKHHFAPAYTDIMNQTGHLSKATLFRRLKNMKKKGMIDYLEGQPRTITVVGDSIEYTKGEL